MRRVLEQGGHDLITPGVNDASVAEPCPQRAQISVDEKASGHAHAWQRLGKNDAGQWTWRCGNCLVVGFSEGEGGGPDPVRAESVKE